MQDNRGLRVVGHDAAGDPAVRAALAVFEREGLRGVTLRSVALGAGVPPATIQRQFQTKERLLQAVLSAFVDEETARLWELARAVGPGPAPREVLADLLCAELARPARRAHGVMLVDLLVAAARDPSFRPLAGRWRRSALSCWEAVVGEDPYAGSLAEFMVELQVGLTLESIGCDGELALQLANLELARLALLGRADAPRFWFRKLLAEAAQERGAHPRPPATEEVRAVLDAGSDLLVGEGSQAISFRSVAAQADVTFSTVASIFRRKESLLSAICDHLVSRAMAIAPPPLTGPRDLETISAIICDMLTAGGRFHGKYFFLGAVELRLLAARNPAFASLARRLRMMNGLYELRKDDPAYDPFGPQAFAVHARTCWANGLGLVQAATEEPGALQASLMARLRAGAPCFEAPSLGRN